jgi:hypothetical protein
LYQQACDDGDPEACNVFGLMYQFGESVPQDPARAAVLFQRACEGGLLVGCTNLGFMYEVGSGVPQDLSRAVGLYQVACEGGEMLGCRGIETVVQTGGSEPVELFAKSGQIGDTETGDALSGAIIEVPELGIRTTSDASGRFELIGLPEGRYSLRAERLGYEMLFGQLEVPGNPEFLVLLTPTIVDDPLAPGRVTGLVTEEGGNRGLSDVEIVVLGQTEARTISNGRGRFNLRDLEPGLAEIRFTRLGYAPRTATLIVQPGIAVELTATMFTQPIELEAIEVTVRSSYLERVGFYRRAGRWGRQFTRQDLDDINPMFVSDLIRRVPGVRIRYGLNGAEAVNRRRTSMSLGACALTVYVDGVRQFSNDLEGFPPEWLEAAEVYTGPGVPIEYRFFSACGVVLLWTQR